MLTALAMMAVQAAAVPPPAAPSPTPEQADARCLFAYAVQAGRPGQDAEAARTAVFFFYGKLLARSPAIDLSGALREAALAVGENLSPELARCGTEVSAAAAAMRRADAALRWAHAP